VSGWWLVVSWWFSVEQAHTDDFHIKFDASALISLDARAAHRESKGTPEANRRVPLTATTARRTPAMRRARVNAVRSMENNNNNNN
jgi:hypothetical protein